MLLLSLAALAQTPEPFGRLDPVWRADGRQFWSYARPWGRALALVALALGAWAIQRWRQAR